MKRTLLTSCNAIAIASLLGTAVPAQAADLEPWTGIPNATATTNWSDTANWAGASHNPNDNNAIFGNATVVGLG